MLLKDKSPGGQIERGCILRSTRFDTCLGAIVSVAAISILVKLEAFTRLERSPKKNGNFLPAKKMNWEYSYPSFLAVLIRVAGLSSTK